MKKTHLKIIRLMRKFLLLQSNYISKRKTILCQTLAYRVILCFLTQLYFFLYNVILVSKKSRPYRSLKTSLRS